jgi:hypothetical protein
MTMIASAGRTADRRPQINTALTDNSQTVARTAAEARTTRTHGEERLGCMRGVGLLGGRVACCPVFCHEGEDSSLPAMHTIPALPTLRIVAHPLVQHKLSILRDRTTPTKIFKELVDEIATLMAYEATSDLPLEEIPLETPLETTIGWRVAGKKLTLVPILRAGLGMVEGICRLVPAARVGHIGLYRDHETLRPVDYYFKIPADAA